MTDLVRVCSAQRAGQRAHNGTVVAAAGGLQLGAVGGGVASHVQRHRLAQARAEHAHSVALRPRRH